MQLTNKSDVKWFIRKRYYVTLLTLCGWFVATILRSNLTIAIINMTYKSKSSNESGTYEKEAEFNWSSMEKGIILSSFSWGYVLSPIGGILTSKFGGTLIFGLGLVVTAFFTLLTPILIRLNIVAFFTCRILEGLAEGFSAASIVDIFLYWAPPNEKSRLMSVAYIGYFAGPGIANPICGLIAKNYGWEAVFFITGGITVLWALFWFTLVTRSPASDKFISAKEKNYLTETINIPIETQIVYPWMEMLKSKAVWAFLNERFVEAWGISFLQICLPLFVKDMLGGRSIDEIGIVSGIPQFSVILGIAITSYICDYLRRTQLLSVSNVHKILIGISHAFCIIILSIMITWMDLTGIIVCLSAFKFFQGCTVATCCVIPIDISQQYSSFINGLAVSVIAVGCILNPIIMGLMVPTHTIAEWKIYFVFLGGIILYGCITFLLYGSGELQPWATSSKDVHTASKREEVTMENDQEKGTRF